MRIQIPTIGGETNSRLQVLARRWDADVSGSSRANKTTIRAAAAGVFTTRLVKKFLYMVVISFQKLGMEAVPVMSGDELLGFLTLQWLCVITMVQNGILLRWRGLVLLLVG